MHVEITRILTEWIKDPTSGVNVLLASVPRKKKISGTAQDEKPKPVAIYNDVDNEVMGEGGVQPPSTPAIVLVCDSMPRTRDTQNPNRSAHRTGEGAVAVFGYYGDQGERSSSIRHGNYALRALKQSLTRFGRAEKSRRQLNGIMIVQIDSIDLQRVEPGVPGSTFLGLLIARLTVLDKIP